MTKYSIAWRNRIRVSSVLSYLAVCLLVSACSFKVKLAAEYDELIDKSVHKLEVETIAHIKMVMDNDGSGDAAYDTSKGFYAAAKGEVVALRVRAGIIEYGLKHTPLSDNFDSLSQQYDDLETLHQMSYNSLVFESAGKSMEQSFQAIVKHLIYLKWNKVPPSQK